ncbi:MAG: FHA domain-containing protein [Myxococcales bacterium]|nr:FHA domain-containing protein [Myxococcales bacterium]
MSNNQPQTPKSYLLLENQGQFLRVFITKPRIFLGHAEDNDIVIRDTHVLPRHAEIFVSGNRYNLVTVAGGQSRINGREAEGVHTLTNGDHLQLGGTQVMYVEELRQSDVALHLIVRRKDELPFGVTITKPMVRIGRMKGDVLIEDDNLSPTHAIIENFCSDAVFVMDAKSKSGTWLNNAKLTGRRRLRSGDTLALGNTQISILYSQQNAAHGVTNTPTTTAEPPNEEANTVDAPMVDTPREGRPHQVRPEHPPTASSNTNKAMSTEPIPAERNNFRPLGEFVPNNAGSSQRRQQEVRPKIPVSPSPYYDEAIPLPDRPHRHVAQERHKQQGSGLTQAIPLDFERPKATRPELRIDENVSDGRSVLHGAEEHARPNRAEPERRDSPPPRSRPQHGVPQSAYQDRYHYLPPEEEDWATHSQDGPSPRVSEPRVNFEVHSENRRGLTQGIPANVVLRKRPQVTSDPEVPRPNTEVSGQYYHPDDQPRRK